MITTLNQIRAQNIIAGALFDFMGYLTSRAERIVLSASDDASPAIDAIRDFAKKRGLSLDDALVREWIDELSTAPTAPTALSLEDSLAAAHGIGEKP
jgi:hypothetical protein